MAHSNTLNGSEKITEMLKLQIGNISEAIEKQGVNIFGGNKNLLSADEINDFCIEFLQLLIELLLSKDPRDESSPQFHAMEVYFNNLSKQLLIRGGKVEDLVRYIQFMQGTLIDILSKDQVGISIADTRDALIFLSSTFNELNVSNQILHLPPSDQELLGQIVEIHFHRMKLRRGFITRILGQQQLDQ